MQQTFTYPSNDLRDPFVSFVKAAEGPPQFAPVDGGDEPVFQRPLTPLQKMNVGEIERGLKCILWGSMGKRAIIEDSAGKGYIVTVGTQVGDKNGVITEIFNDRLVIQQQHWDGKLQMMLPQYAVVKLAKGEEKK